MLLRFLVIRVLPAGVAELRELEAAGGRLLVLRGGVVPVLAIRALQCDDLAHLVNLLLTWPATSAGKQRLTRRDAGQWPLLPNPDCVTEEERSGHARP